MAMSELVEVRRIASFGIGRGCEEAELMAQVPDTRRVRRVLRDLETLMMAEGFLRLSTEDIAKRLGCSKSTLYRLAESRDELFELVIERWLARVRDAGWRECEAAEDWPGRVIAFLSGAINLATREASYKFMQDLRALPSGYRALMTHQHQRMADLEAILLAGVEVGAFHDVHPKLAADLIWTSVQRAIEPDFLASVGLTLTQAFDEWYRILEYGLLRQTPAPKEGRGARSPRSRSSQEGPRSIEK